MYLYINNKFLQEQLNANPTAWYENSMFNVDENTNENDSLDKDPTTSNELDEDEIEHDPFEFLHGDEIPFSRLLFNLTIWQAQGSNNGDANPNMLLLNDNVQVSNAPP
jgi:hypothetical protein